MSDRKPPSCLRQVLALGCTQTLAWASSTYLPAILAQPIARDLDISRSTVFGAFSVSLVVMALAGPAVGRTLHRNGRRRPPPPLHRGRPAGLGSARSPTN